MKQGRGGKARERAHRVGVDEFIVEIKETVEAFEKAVGASSVS